MFCPHCGAVTRDDHAFCPACGTALAGSRHWAMAPELPASPLRLIGEPAIRMLVIAVGGLVALLLLTELVKVVFAAVLPVLIVVALLYWARQRRRRYY